MSSHLTNETRECCELEFVFSVRGRVCGSVSKMLAWYVGSLQVNPHQACWHISVERRTRRRLPTKGVWGHPSIYIRLGLKNGVEKIAPGLRVHAAGSSRGTYHPPTQFIHACNSSSRGHSLFWHAQMWQTLTQTYKVKQMYNCSVMSGEIMCGVCFLRATVGPYSKNKSALPFLELDVLLEM